MIGPIASIKHMHALVGPGMSSMQLIF
jgi:hypothetical protein